MEELKHINIDFGSRLKNARTASKLSSEELSELIGISTRFLASVESGKNGFSIKNIKKACEVLGITSDSLLMTPHKNNDVPMIIEKIKSIDPAYYPMLDNMINNIRAIDQERIEKNS